MATKEESRADAAAGSREPVTESPKEAKSQERGRQPEQAVKTKPREAGLVRHRQPTTPDVVGGSMGPVARLRDEFDRLFEQFSRGWLGMPTWRGSWGLDVRENDTAVTVRAEAPGFEPGDFDIQARDDRLVMCACRGGEEKEEGGQREWRRNEFYESVVLPATVDADKVTATYRHGVLTVTLPKTEAEKARRIAVQG
ncbi:Hsp20/alpha crystallin family protein [bacterium]|nr:Hsp20/alpha crystallin family protein [bacterium]